MSESPSPQDHPEPPATTDRKSRLKTWHTYRQRPAMRLAEAVALALDKAPKTMLEKIRNGEETSKSFNALLRTARYACIENGPIKVHQQVGGDDGAEWIVDTESFVKFVVASGRGNLTEEFKSLAHSPPSAPTSSVTGTVLERAPKKIKASLQFCTLMSKLLVAIAYQAGAKNEQFNIDAMPGTKGGFQKFAARCNTVFGSYAEPTFDDYIESFCKFLPGSRPSDFFDKLFEGHPPQIK